jgi:DNA-binding MarR family transcriptional regulator
MPQAGTRSDAGLATALRISISRLARRLRVERLGLGGTETVLSDIQLAALAALERNQAMTPGELAEYEKVQPPSMTRVIAVLEERNLVQREPHPTDRRQVILTVTAEGRALVNRVRRRREAWLTQRLQELTPEERATLRAAAPILEKLSQSLNRRAELPGAHGCVARSGARSAEHAADEVDLFGGPLGALVSLQAGDDAAHVDGRAAAGERQVRLETTSGVRRDSAGPAGRRADRGRELR